MQRGYALSGTGRNPQRNFNYDPDREQQELISVIDMFNARYGKPTKVIQYGHSGGGFVALNFAERYPEKVDGVVVGCAHEPVPLMNMMLDGWFVLKTLIASELQVVGFSDLASVADQSAKWRAALTLAQQSQEGRARIALAAAVGQWPVWSNATRAQPDPFDLGALQSAVFDTVLLNAAQPGGQSRFMFEHAGTSPATLLECGHRLLPTSGPRRAGSRASGAIALLDKWTQSPGRSCNTAGRDPCTGGTRRLGVLERAGTNSPRHTQDTFLADAYNRR